MWTQFLIGGVFLFLGVAIHIFKWYFLISGYNTMSKEKKAKVDTHGLGKIMGIYCYFNGSLFILGGILQRLGYQSLGLIVLIFFGVSTVFLLVKAQRYDGNLYDEEGKLREGAGKKLILPLALAAAVLLFVMGLSYFSTQETQVSYTEEGLEVHGLYGGTYSWETIDSAEIMDDFPEVLRKNGGSSFGPHLKGRFNLEGLGQTTLFVDLRYPPFLLLETSEGPVILNFKSETKTREAYERILKR